MDAPRSTAEYTNALIINSVGMLPGASADYTSPSMNVQNIKKHRLHKFLTHPLNKPTKMRRLPVYLLIDTSGSMKGEPIESVKVGLETMISSLRQDPFALESVCISIITFDKEVKQILPLTPLDDLQLPEITTPDSGPTHTGQALQLLCRMIDTEVRMSSPDQKGDWMPLLFLMTDGKPSDIQLYKEMIPEVKKRRFAGIIACAAGMKARTEPLKELTDEVYALDTVDSTAFRQFFKWVSDSIGIGNRSIGATDVLELPPPPEEVNLIL